MTILFAWETDSNHVSIPHAQRNDALIRGLREWNAQPRKVQSWYADLQGCYVNDLLRLGRDVCCGGFRCKRSSSKAPDPEALGGREIDASPIAPLFTQAGWSSSPHARNHNFATSMVARHRMNSLAAWLPLCSAAPQLWSVETHAYRDHLLRPDPESRRNRFCGGIADDTIRSYAATARGAFCLANIDEYLFAM